MRFSLALLGALVLFLSACERPEPGPAAKPVHQSRAKVQFDEAVFTAALDRIAAWHDSVGTGWSAPAGPERTAIEATFEELPFTVNDELALLWERWGTPPTDRPLIFDYLFLSAERARARYDALRADASVPWRPNWIPVFAAGERWLLVESSRSGAPAGPVVAYRIGEAPVVAFTNLTQLARTVADVLDTAGWTGEHMVVGEPALRRAHAEHNADLTLPDHVLGSR